MGGNLGVQRPDRGAGGFELLPNFPVGRGGCRVEVGDFQRLQEMLQG